MKLRLLDLREDKDLTQAEFAKELDIAQTTYSGYETGNRRIPIEILIRIADYYDTSIDYLVGRTDDPAPPKR